MNIAARVHGFTAELRRRHVVRVGVVYCAVAWAFTEASATLMPALGVPQWGLSLVAVMAVTGLPATLLLAWAFDVTPTGVQRTPARAALPSEPAILALPFADRSAGADHQYLGDGITEELINSLARVHGLRVVSRTSAFALRDHPVDTAQLRDRLGVTHVVEGSVGVLGQRMRLTAQLVDVSNGYILWSRTYDRRLDDVFCVQQEVAGALVTALQPELVHATSPAHPSPASGPSFDAYALYLRGRALWNARSPDAVRRALGHFRSVLELEPGYAPALAGIADCWSILIDHGVESPVVLPQARDAAVAAMSLAPASAEAHTSHAFVQQLEWRWSAAEQALRRALELNRGYVPARQRLALLLAWLGRTDEARRHVQHALRDDPLSTVVMATSGWVEYFAGAFDEAIDTLTPWWREHADVSLALPLGWSLIAAGRHTAALDLLDALRSEGGSDAHPPFLAMRAHASARSPDGARAAEIARDLERAAGEAWVSPLVCAQAWLAASDNERMMHWLERGVATRTPQMIHLLEDPLWEELRRTPAGTALLQQVRG